MTTRLPPDLLQRAPQEAARLLALTYLDEIGLAQIRLVDGSDDEALHDFRVGLRRLRSCFRAYREQLKGSVSSKMRRRLRELTLATNAGRDLEVQLTWLRQESERMTPAEVAGLAWLTGRLEGRKHASTNPITTGVAGKFVKTAAKLRPELTTFRTEVRTARERGSPAFGHVVAGLTREYALRLAEDLKAVRTADDISEAHAARLDAKRLRYLLEPLARRVAGTKKLVTRLKELQDTLGELHDRQLLVREIVASLAGPPGIEPGLLALQRRANEQADAAFQRFEGAWAEGRAADFFRRADELASGLIQAGRSRVEAGVGMVLLAPEPASTPPNTSDAPDGSRRATPERRLLRSETRT